VVRLASVWVELELELALALGGAVWGGVFAAALGADGGGEGKGKVWAAKGAEEKKGEEEEEEEGLDAEAAAEAAEGAEGAEGAGEAEEAEEADAAEEVLAAASLRARKVCESADWSACLVAATWFWYTLCSVALITRPARNDCDSQIEGNTGISGTLLCPEAAEAVDGV
jgi:hypothetical protein